ncbi:alpha/beta fold hydrolase [Capillimicrobium parvum]|nr:alpha/beta hydrolase [Capillimicrobium parvum]
MLRTVLPSLIAALALAAPSAAGAQAPTSVPVQTVAVNGATLGYRVLNPDAKGRPLVLICGYGFTMSEWDPSFVERLAQGRTVVLFDNRGIGTSSGPVKGLTIQTMADDTAGLIRALKLGRPDVLGWSMGGYVAQELALDSPRLVRRLILASTDPGSPRAKEPSSNVVATLTNPDLTPSDLLPVLFPSDQQAAGQAWLAAVGAQPNLTAADFNTPGDTMNEQELANAQRWYGRGQGTYARLPKLRARTLIGYGTQDVIVPPGNAKLLARRIPHRTLMRVPDAGHAFLFQQPAAKAAAFDRFLDRR